MKKYLLPIIIATLGVVITVTIVFYKPKNKDNRQETIPLAQVIEQKLPEKVVQQNVLQTDQIPLGWKAHLSEIKKLLFKDFVEQDNDWYDIVGSINNPVNKSFVDITGDGSPELMISTAMRPAGGTCFNVLRLNNDKVEFINQISPMDHRLVETPVEGCIIGNGINGANFELDALNKAIVSLEFQESDGGLRKSSCRVTAWVWNDLKAIVVIDEDLSSRLTNKTCTEMDDFLNGR